MANGFVITAQVQLRGPANVGPVVSNIRKQLSNINATVNVQMPRNIGGQINNLQTQLQNLNKTINALGSGRQAQNNLNNIGNAIQKISKQSNQAKSAAFEFGEAIGQAARKFAAFSLAAGSIVALTGAIQAGVSAAIDFQNELVRLEQIGGNFGGAVGNIASEITNLSTTLGVSSKELLGVASTLRQAGLSAEDTRVALRAIAESSLAPTFGDVANTVEGAIGVMQQFNVEAKELYGILGTINRVSADFAVESEDIVHAIRRSGGAFKAAGGSLNELISLFTSVRQTTRESAETIATGFNTIFARIQRPESVEKLRLLGINLRYSAEEARAFGKTEGEFVGPFEAISRLNQALLDVPTASAEYAAIVEEIGGFRQVSKVIPLIQQFPVALKAYQSALGGVDSLSQSTAIAQDSLIVQLTRVQENFLSLFRELGNNSTLQEYAKLFLTLANGAINFTRALEPLVPLVLTLGAVKGLSNIGLITKTDFRKGLAKGLTSNRFATGGVVPGAGNGDTVPAMLTPGEFVIRKASAKAIGYSNLHQMNRYANGGIVKMAAGGRFRPREDQLFPLRNEEDDILDISVKDLQDFEAGRPIPAQASDALKKTKYANATTTNRNNLEKFAKARETESSNSLFLPYGNDLIGAIGFGTLGQSGPTPSKRSVTNVLAESNNAAVTELLKPYKDVNLTYTRYIVSREMTQDFDQTLNEPVGNAIIGAFLSRFGDIPGMQDSLRLSKSELQNIKGVLFEKYVRALSQTPLMSDSAGDDVWDFLGGLNPNSSINTVVHPSPLPNGPNVFLDGKIKLAAPKVPASLASKYLAVRGGGGLPIQRRALGGSINNVSDSDTVPALLTPGEFVINRNAARTIGYNNLGVMNKTGKVPVGVQKFATGGYVTPGYRRTSQAYRSLNQARALANMPAITPTITPINYNSIGAPQRSGGSTTDRLLQQILNEIKRTNSILGGKVQVATGGAPANAAAAAAAAVVPGKGGILSTLGRPGFASVLAAQYFPQIAGSVLGTPTKPGMLGQSAAIGGTVLAGAASNAATFAAAGSVGGPVGTIVGGTLGALYGGMQAWQQAAEEIVQFDFEKQMTSFGSAVERANNNLGKLDTSDISGLLSGLNAISDRANSASDRGAFLGRDVNRDQIGSVQTRIIRDLEFSAEDVNSQASRLAKFGQAAGGVGQQLAQLQAEIQNISLLDFNKQLDEVLKRAAFDQNRERQTAKLNESITRQTKSFESLGQAVQSATSAISDLQLNADSIFQGTQGSAVQFALPTFSADLGSLDVAKLRRSVNVVVNSFDNSGKDLANVFKDTALGVNAASSKLPGVLTQFAASTAGGPDEFRKLLDQAAPDVAEGVRDNLVKALQTFDIGDAREKIRDNALEFAAELEKRAYPTITSAFETVLNGLKERFQQLDGDLSKYQQLSNQVVDSQTKAVGLSVDFFKTQASIFGRRTGRSGLANDISPRILDEPQIFRQRALTGRFDASAFDAQALGRDLNAVTQRIAQVQQERSRLVETNVRSPEVVRASSELAALSNQSQRLQQALGNLANVSERTANIQDRLSQLQKEESDRLSIAEDIQTSSPSELLRMRFNVSAASAAASQGNLTGFSSDTRKAILDITKKFDEIRLGEFGGLTGRELRENLLRNDPLTAGIANLPGDKQVERAGLENALLQAMQQGVIAQNTLTGFLQTSQSKFFQELLRIQDGFFAKLDASSATVRLQDVSAKQLGQQGTVTALQSQQESLGRLRAAGLKDVPEARSLLNSPRLADLAKTQKQANINVGNLSFDENVQLAMRDIINNFKDSLSDGFERQDWNKVVNDLASQIETSIAAQGFSVNRDSIRREIISQPAITTALSREGSPDQIVNLITQATRSALGNRVQQANEARQSQIAQLRQSNPTAAALSGPELTSIISNFEALSKDLNNLNGVQSAESLNKQFSEAQVALKGFTDQITDLTQRIEAANARINVPPAEFRARGGAIMSTSAYRQIFQPRGTDTVPAMLSPGEFVINAQATKANRQVLEAINSGKTSFFGGSSLGGSLKSTISSSHDDVLYKQTGGLVNIAGRKRRPRQELAPAPFAFDQKALNALTPAAFSSDAQIDLRYNRNRPTFRTPNANEARSILALAQRPARPGDNETAVARRKYGYYRTLIERFPNTPEAQIAAQNIGNVAAVAAKADLANALTTDNRRSALLGIQYRYAGTGAANLAAGALPFAVDKMPQAPAQRLPGTNGVQVSPRDAFVQRAQLINRRRQLKGLSTLDFARSAAEKGFAPLTQQELLGSASFQTGRPGRRRYMATGGPAVGTDVVPAMLTPGEFIVSRDAARSNMGLLHAINKSKGPLYRQTGGPIGAGVVSTGGSSVGMLNMSPETLNSLQEFNVIFADSVNRLSSFTDAANTLNAFSNDLSGLIGSLGAFSQNIMLMKQPFDAFVPAATNLGIGLNSFSQASTSLTAALNNLANLPQTITVQGTTQVNVVVTGAEAFNALSQQLTQQILQAASERLKPEIIAELKNGNVVG